MAMRATAIMRMKAKASTTSLSPSGVPLNGHERIDRHALGLRIEVRNDLQHLQAVLDGLAEAEDAAAADGHAGVLRMADGAETIFKSCAC
jgi:hypothetical protein